MCACGGGAIVADAIANVLVLEGHPDASKRHLGHALADAYAAGAEAAGHTVRRIDIARLAVRPLTTEEEFTHQKRPPAIAEAQEAIHWAEHVVLVFPLWLGTVPALVKAFLEQVMRPDFAFAYAPNGMAKKLLGGRSARLIVTMGMPGCSIAGISWRTGCAGSSATSCPSSASIRCTRRFWAAWRRRAWRRAPAGSRG